MEKNKQRTTVDRKKAIERKVKQGGKEGKRKCISEELERKAKEKEKITRR